MSSGELPSSQTSISTTADGKANQPPPSDGQHEEDTADLASPDLCEPDPTVGFPIVGIGASAGGLDAFRRLFARMPMDTGMAFVVLQHHASDDNALADLMADATTLPVTQVEGRTALKPNHIYVTAPNRAPVIERGYVHVRHRAPDPPPRWPIDRFLISLAEAHGPLAIGVILSGNGSDGAQGLKAIKDGGGLTIVQTPDSAECDGMPLSALATGVADYVVPPEEMAQCITDDARRALAAPARRGQAGGEARDAIFGLLRRQTGHDFSGYKAKTIRRRIERRMAMRQIDEIDRYIALLHHHPDEVDALYRELLIGVTRFFRDPHIFTTLAHEVIPHLMQRRAPDHPLRVWVPGCATGEEAYSLAILLHEYLEHHDSPRDVHIFATDIDEDAIAQARAGIYPQTIADDVSTERLRRYFVRKEDMLQVRPQIRDTVFFAAHSLLKDPPFSNLDLISCRNVLIYLGRELQQHVLSTFHQALNAGGYLLLGHAETPGPFTPYFDVVNSRARLYRRPDDGATPPASGAPTPLRVPHDGNGRHTVAQPALSPPQLQRDDTPPDRRVAMLQQALRATNAELHDTIMALDAANAELAATQEELETSPEALQSLNAALVTAHRELAAKIATLTQAYHAMGQRLTEQHKTRAELEESHQWFRTLVENSPDLIARFDRQLRHLYVNPAVERTTGISLADYVGKTNAELAHPPELIAVWNREIEKVFATGKQNALDFAYTDAEGRVRYLASRLAPEFDDRGEVKTVLSVVRDVTEAQETKAALAATTDRYRALFEGATNPIVLYDRHARIQLANRAAARLLHAQPEELLGKSVRDLFPGAADLLAERISQALQTGENTEFIDCFDLPHGRRWYLSMLQPLSMSDVWGEAVQVISYDITERRQAEEMLRKREQQLVTAMKNLPAGVVYREGERLWTNEAVETLTGYTQQELATTVAWFDCLHSDRTDAAREAYNPWRVPDMTTLPITTKDGSVRFIEFAGVHLGEEEDILVMHDVTAQYEAAANLEEALQEKETLLRELYHRTKNNMQVISAILDVQASHIQDPTALEAIAETKTRIRSIALVHQKLYESANLSSIDLGAYIVDLTDLLMISYRVTSERVAVELALDPMQVLIDIAMPCGLILNELISNALKHAFPEGRSGTLKLTLQRGDGAEVTLSVADDGVGVPEGFDFRAQSSLGLQTVFAIAEHQLQGDVHFTDSPGGGVTCHIVFRDNIYIPRV